MRLPALTIGLLAVFAPIAAAWSKEDREIFRVRDELAAALGPDVTFYDFVGVSPGASLDDINKAYRKKTRQLHPDKVKQQLAADRAKAAKKDGSGKGKKPGVHVAKSPSASEVRAAVKQASEMQARLGIVTNVLRGPERDRYDHFLAHGFPVWKGTEYYYNRYRPGFGTVLFGLFVFVGGGAHYLALYMGWKRQREFVERYIRYARHAAWGNQFGDIGVGSDVGLAAADVAADDDAPQANAVAVNRKQRRMQERDAKREAAKEATGGRRARRGPAAATASGTGSSGSATPTPQAPAGPTGAKKRVVAENGKILVVDSLGDVYLEQIDEDGKVEELLLDINEVARPTFRDTAVFRLPVWVFGLTAGRLLKGKGAEEHPVIEEAHGEDAPPARNAAKSAPRKAKPTRPAPAPAVSDDEDSDSSPGKATPSTDSQEEYEIVNKSTGSLTATGASQNRDKANKRRGRKK